MSIEKAKLKNNVGLSVKLENMSVMNTYKIFSINNSPSESEHQKVMENITKRGRVYALMILDQENELSSLMSMSELANTLNIKCTDKKNQARNVRKAINDLYPVIEAEQVQRQNDENKHSKEWFYTNFYIAFGQPNKGYTQLPCGLLKIKGITPDLIVVFTVLNYFKTKFNNLDINPSHKKMALLSCCSERKMYTLLEQGKTLGIWKYEAIKGTRSTNIYNISYIKDDEEHYYFYDVLKTQKMEKESIEKYLQKEKTDKAQ